MALAANGAVATASSTGTGSGFSTTGAINGNNRGPWGNGEGWNDATPGSVPDWIQVDFAGSKTIDEINVFSLHDNYATENTPTETQTFTLYGLLAFNVQYWNGSSWTTVPGGGVTGNNKVWRKFTFAPITTNKIRVTINATPDAWSRVVEIQAFGTSAGGEKVQWLVPDHLGTPRIIVDQTGSLANVRRHDYLPFGEELFAGTGGRTVAHGYAADGVRQQFTGYERDNETGLDYAKARYYANMQGRFTGVDPYDINYERQNTTVPEEADALFRNYVEQPQHWNRYAYALNNPLRYVDPDGRLEYETELLGKKIKVKISDNLKSAEGQKLKGDDLKAAQEKIKNNVGSAIAKINSGADKMTSEQKTAINSMKGIEVRTDISAPGMNTASKVFYLTQQYAGGATLDTLTAGIIHDSFHADQSRRGVKSSGLEAEKQASAFALTVFDKVGITDANLIRDYQKDAKEGHGGWSQRTRPPKKKTP